MSNRTKIEPDGQAAATTQKPSPLNGVALPRPPKGNRYAETHGLISMKKALAGLGSRAVDGRTSLGYALKKWRKDLINDLGGPENVSVQQEALVDLAVKSKLLLDSIDAWLLVQPTLVNKQKKTLLPVVVQRTALANSFASYLNQLGLERRHKIKTLSDILNEDTESETHSDGA
jgi:hypothetical protein